jgi:uncharacterized protein (TIGR04255 family)
MGEKLEAPPLVEAVCEMRLAPTTNAWDWTLPGRLYDKIKNEFPNISEVPGILVNLGPEAPTAPPFPERLQMKRKDSSAMVQVAPYVLAVNQLTPYPGWEGFKALILSVYSQYAGICVESRIVRVGLRYINQITLPPKGFDLGAFITMDPVLNGPLDRPLVTFYQRYELQHDSPGGVLIHQTGIQAVAGKPHLMVDLDFVSPAWPSDAKCESIASWLDQAHGRIYESFVASLNKDLYNRLRSGKP